MKIVGGTYTERCDNPEFDNLAGSGLRAAAALTHAAEAAGDRVELVTACHPYERKVADMTAAGLNLGADAVTWLTRTRPVGFSYFTPITAPTVNGMGARLVPDDFGDGSVTVDDGDLTLVFGMMEEPDINVTSDRVVLDPQRPRELLSSHLPKVKAAQTAWTLNERETRQLAGVGRRPLEEMSRLLLDKYDLDVVVTKRAARGALVTTRDIQVPIGAFRTNSVFSIGSGDIFASAFAWAWGHEGADPVEAARVASAAAAHWCETQDYEIPARTLRGEKPRWDELPPDNGAKVYLAGPFFNVQQRWMVDIARVALSPQVFSPFHEVGPGGNEVAQKDLDGLRECDAVLALLDDHDPGTIFEAGYATSLGIPVVGCAESVDPEGLKMLSGTGAKITGDISTAVYQAVWAAIEHKHATLDDN